MDLSKLPRLSETDKHAPAPADAPAFAPPEQSQRPMPLEYAPPAPTGAAAEAWFSIALGIIIQLMNSRFLSFLMAKVSGQDLTGWTFSDANGAPISYTQTVFFLGDLAMVLFGLVLIAEGIVIGFVRKRPLIMIAFVLTLLTTLLNLYYVISMMNEGYGLQLMSALAVAFGGYIAAYEWRLLQVTRPVTRA